MKLRPYQWDAICSIWDYFKSGKSGNPVVAMPTGTGKSVVIAGFIRSIFDQYQDQRILVLTHVKELIAQNYDKMMAIWPTAPAGIYSSGLNRKDLYNNITFGGIASVVKKADKFGHIDLVLIDEAHLVSPQCGTMYQKFINDLISYNPNLKIIGFTATPYRLSQGMIIEEGGLFTDICYDITSHLEFNKLIEEGYLAPLIPKKTELMLNVDGVHMRGNEFISKELQLAVDKQELTEAAVKEAIELGNDRKSWLVFTSGIKHAINTAEILNSYGISAKAIHSNTKDYPMSDSERDQIIEDFKSGKIQALVNSDMLTTGFDHPLIDLIIILRPTNSPGLWVQMLGRGTRVVYANGYNLDILEERLLAIKYGGKENCLVLDFGGNTKRLGPINDPLVPSAKGKKRKGTAPVKLCQGITSDNKICNVWVHASVRICPECGNEFKFETKLRKSASTDELIKIDLPIVEEFKVTHITYSEHSKNGKSSLKVSYHCGLRMFTEYVCIEHDGHIRHKALSWWNKRTSVSCPSNVKTALTLTDTLKPSTSLRVWVNKKYPEIMAHCLDGTHFGKEEPNKSSIPTIKSNKGICLNLR